MIDLIIYNLQMIGCAMLLLAGAWTANMILGLYSNVMLFDEKFDKSKLRNGALKLLTLCAGTAIASIVVTLFPKYLTTYGIQLHDDTIETFSIVVISATYAVAIVKYLKEFLNKLTDILK